MGWLDYYNLIESYKGDLSKASKEELDFAARCNPNDPITAKQIAYKKWAEKQQN